MHGRWIFYDISPLAAWLLKCMSQCRRPTSLPSLTKRTNDNEASTEIIFTTMSHKCKDLVCSIMADSSSSVTYPND